jgi:hypothetical protein
MKWLKKIFGKKINTIQKSTTNKQEKTEISTNSKPKGAIRFVLMVVFHPIQTSTPQMSAFLMDLLPDLNSQNNRNGKIGLIWKPDPIDLIDLQSLAIKTFGEGITDTNTYIYRTLHLGIDGGDVKCLVVYDK